MSRMYGYARVSTADQDLNIQKDALRKAGCETIREEKRSGGTRQGRDELDTLLAFLRAGDTLVVTRIDRLARSIGDLQDIVRLLKANGVSLKATEQPIDTSTAAGKAFLDMLGVFAEFETNLRKERQSEGIAQAKERGVYTGRKPSIDRAHVLELRATGLGASEIAEIVQISRASVYRILDMETKKLTRCDDDQHQATDVKPNHSTSHSTSDPLAALRLEPDDPTDDPLAALGLTDAAVQTDTHTEASPQAEHWQRRQSQRLEDAQRIYESHVRSEKTFDPDYDPSTDPKLQVYTDAIQEIRDAPFRARERNILRSASKGTTYETFQSKRARAYDAWLEEQIVSPEPTDALAAVGITDDYECMGDGLGEPCYDDGPTTDASKGQNKLEAEPSTDDPLAALGLTDTPGQTNTHTEASRRAERLRGESLEKAQRNYDAYVEMKTDLNRDYNPSKDEKLQAYTDAIQKLRLPPGAHERNILGSASKGTTKVSKQQTPILSAEDIYHMKMELGE